jgi:hypothetical protein
MSGCKKQSSKKYQTRKSPSYPANKCQGQVKKGNDGTMYTSKRASNGVYRWQKSASKKSSTKKSSTKRSASKRVSSKRSGTKISAKRSASKSASSKRSVKRSVSKRSSSKGSGKRSSSKRSMSKRSAAKGSGRSLRRYSSKKKSNQRKFRPSRLAGKTGYLYVYITPKEGIMKRHKLPAIDLKLVGHGVDLETGVEDFQYQGPGNEIPTADIIVTTTLEKLQDEGKIKKFSVKTKYF